MRFYEQINCFSVPAAESLHGAQVHRFFLLIKEQSHLSYPESMSLIFRQDFLMFKGYHQVLRIGYSAFLFRAAILCEGLFSSSGQSILVYVIRYSQSHQHATVSVV